MEKVKNKRTQTVGEEIANATSHGVMTIFGVVALVLLLIKQNSNWELLSSLIFGVSIIFLYLMSTLYHSLSFTKSKHVFKRLDHVAIYILIGGTFAPALLLLPSLRESYLFNNPDLIDMGLFMFIGQWILIVVGIVFKSIWVYKMQALHVVIFLLIGWSAIYFITDLYNFKKIAMYLILFGGISYSVGVIFYSLSKIKYFHFIWHLFVALGTILQFLAIYLYLM